MTALTHPADVSAIRRSVNTSATDLTLVAIRRVDGPDGYHRITATLSDGAETLSRLVGMSRCPAKAHTRAVKEIERLRRQRARRIGS